MVDGRWAPKGCDRNADDIASIPEGNNINTIHRGPHVNAKDMNQRICSRQLAQNNRFQNHHAHLLPIGIAGVVDLDVRAWLFSSGGARTRPRSSRSLSGSSSPRASRLKPALLGQKPGAKKNRGPARGQKNERLPGPVWSLYPGSGSRRSSVWGPGDTLIHTQRQSLASLTENTRIL